MRAITAEEWVLESAGDRVVEIVGRPHSRDILVTAKYGGGAPRIAMGVGADIPSAWAEAYRDILNGGTFCRPSDHAKYKGT